MQKNKGLYLLIAFISVILIFFFLLFFMHERTLENGILFKVSFEYENAKNITYNFYNQNGKIGKVENWENYETSYLLEKTDYNSVKLLRRLLKGKKELKEPSKEEGITIYNGQNKRYYFLPFDSEGAEELSNLIIDGYIHAEMKRTTEKTYNELYLYEKEDGLNWTKDGNTSRIINTYQCEVEDCKYLYVDVEQETVLLDKENYFYNYVTKEKEQINTTENIKSLKYIKWDGKIIGMTLQNENNHWSYYDLEKKECLTEFNNQKIKVINNDKLLTIQEQKKDSLVSYSLQVWNRFDKEILWKKEITDNNNLDFEVEEKDNLYIIKRIENKKISFQVLKENGDWLLSKFIEEVELTEDHNIIIKTQEENETIYEKYNKEGILLKKGLTKEELYQEE